jgi:hypothetical protein
VPADKITAQNFVATLDHPVIRVYAVGDSGRDTALLADADEPELGFEWAGFTGTVREDGTWEWDGERADDDKPTDTRGNDVLNVWIRDDREEHGRQEAEWLASA